MQILRADKTAECFAAGRPMSATLALSPTQPRAGPHDWNEVGVARNHKLRRVVMKAERTTQDVNPCFVVAFIKGFAPELLCLL